MPVASLSEQDEKAMAEPEETAYRYLTACPKNGFLNHYNSQSSSRNPKTRPKGSAQVLQGLGLLGPWGRKLWEIGLRYVIELACFSHP